MARQDIANMLTGMGGAGNRPNPNMSSSDWRMAFGAQQAQGLMNAAGTTTPQEAIQMGIGKLDLGTVKGLQTLGQMQQIRGDLKGTAQTAAAIEALKAKQKLPEQAEAVAANLPASYASLAKAIRAGVPGALEQGVKIMGAIPDKTGMDIKYIVDPVTQTTKGNVIQKNGKLYNTNGIEINLETDVTNKNWILSDNYVKPPNATTSINTGKSAEAIKAELQSDMTLSQFETESKAMIKRGDLTKESYDKFMPIYQQLEALEASGAVGEGGAGTAFFADATNYLTTAIQTLDPSFIVPVGVSAQIQYEAMSKLLKAKMTEMTKGAISDRENAEHNKYTLSVNMPKAVRKGKLNMDKAILMSANNRVNAEEQWFDKHKTTVGFRAAWERYTSDFARTSGATIRNETDANGKTTKKLVDNFEMIEDNMRLFDRLYLNKKTSGSPVFTNGEERTSLKQVKASLREAKLLQLMNNQQVNTPSKLMEEDADRFVRKNIGTVLLKKLDLEGWRVSK